MRFGLRFLIVLALVALCVWVVAGQFPMFDVGVDDANIYLVYAQNLAAGHGVVFNVGGERVEGFSDPLWVGIATFFCAVTSAPMSWLLAFNVVLVALTLPLLVSRLEDALSDLSADGESSEPRVLSGPFVGVLVWCLASPGFVCWTTVTLMDAALWSALVVAAATVVADVSVRRDGSPRSQGLLALLIVGMLLCRSEGPLWVSVFLGLALVMRVRECGRVGQAIRELALPLVALPATLGVGVAARLAYFGYPLPNTYYAKVSPDTLYNLAEGWTYFTGFLSDNVFAALFSIVSVVSALLLLWRYGLSAVAAIRGSAELRVDGPDRDNRFESAFWVFSVTVVAGLVTPILVGGDHFASFRFYQPIWPLLPIPATFAAVAAARRFDLANARLGRLGTIATTAGLATTLAVVFSAANSASWRDLGSTNLRHEFAIALAGRMTGTFLNDLFSAGELPSVGVIASGGIKVTYLGEAIDLAGLNHIGMGHSSGDRHGLKSHAAFNKDVFFSLLPDLIVPPSALLQPSIPLQYCHGKFRGGVMDTATKSLFRDDRFTDAYSVALLGLSGGRDERSLCAYFRNDFLESVQRASSKRGYRIRYSASAAVSRAEPGAGS